MELSIEYEVLIPTKGERLDVVLAGLIMHAAENPFPLTILTARWPQCDELFLESLRQLGCSVRVEYDTGQGGIAGARAQAIVSSRYKTLVFVDDDTVVTPIGAFDILAKEAQTHNWVAPIIRYAQNFHESGIDGHTEVWGISDRTNPKVREALATQGKEWARVFDFGHDIISNHLGGTCFAATYEHLVKGVGGLSAWGDPDIGGEDQYLGLCMGQGLIKSGIYAYHWGRYKGSEWGVDKIANRLLIREPKTYRRMTVARPD